MKWFPAFVLLILFSACATPPVVENATSTPVENATSTPVKSEFMTPAEATKRVASGEAVLIDVREPEEWEEGVVKSAYLLPLSNLRGDRELWNDFLQKHPNQEIILYCRSGNRSGIAAGILAEEGFDVANAGGYRDWQAAGSPKRSLEDPRTDP